MPTSSHQLDFLTFSPSLLQILSLLGLDDVITCKRVSHRFYDLIRGNSKSLPQQPIRLHIHTKRKENSEDIAYVNVCAYFKRKEYATVAILFKATITKRMLLLEKCKVSSMLDHYTEQWKMMGSSHSLAFLDPELTCEFDISNGEGLLNVYIYSIKEELQYALQSVLAHYSIEHIELDLHGLENNWNTPDEVRDVLVDSIRQRRFSRKLPDPSCETINVRSAWPRLDELCQLVDTRNLRIHTQNIPLEGQLSYMLNWEHATHIQIFHTDAFLNCIPFIRISESFAAEKGFDDSFLQAWAEGSCRIKALWLHSTGVLEPFEFAQLKAILREGLPRCEIITEPPVAPGDDEELAEAQIFIKRPADDVVLYMGYSIFYRFNFIIYDGVPKKGKPLEFDDNMFNIR